MKQDLGILAVSTIVTHLHFPISAQSTTIDRLLLHRGYRAIPMESHRTLYVCRRCKLIVICPSIRQCGLSKALPCPLIRQTLCTVIALPDTLPIGHSQISYAVLCLFRPCSSVSPPPLSVLAQLTIPFFLPFGAYRLTPR